MFDLLDKMNENMGNVQKMDKHLNDIIIFHNKALRWVCV